DRPRPRALRAVHRPLAVAGQQRDDGADLPVRDYQGAAGRISRLDRAGDPAHHGRDQDGDPPPRPRPRRRDHGNRWHGGRHRVAAVSRGDPPVPPGSRPRQYAVHPPHPRSLHRRYRRAQDQTHATFRPRADADRNPARYPDLPYRAAALGRVEAQDRAVLQRRLRLRGREPGREIHLRSEEHTSELQSQSNLVCRLLLEKKKKKTRTNKIYKTYTRKNKMLSTNIKLNPARIYMSSTVHHNIFTWTSR